MAAGADILVPWSTGWACLEPTGGSAASIEPRRPRTAESAVESADGHLMLSRSRGATGQVWATFGALSMAGRTMDGPDGRTDGRSVGPRWERGYKLDTFRRPGTTQQPARTAATAERGPLHTATASPNPYVFSLDHTSKASLTTVNRDPTTECSAPIATSML